MLQVGNISITENNIDTTAVFSITLSISSSNTVTVDYATSDGTATASEDYVSKNGTLSFAPGEISKTVTVDVMGDTIPEQDETFSLTLSNPDNAELDTNVDAVATIVDDDTVVTLPVLPVIQIGNISIIESDLSTTAAAFSITLSSTSSNTVTVDYATSDGTATTSEDYVSKNGTLSFVPGETSKTVTVDVMGDTIPEQDETFSLTLSNPDNADLDNNVDGVATIVDDDTAITLPVIPVLQIGNISVSESDSSTTAAAFSITLSSISSNTVTVDYTTSDGTAIASEDYVSKNGTLSFAPGETSKTVMVDVIGDVITEFDETFQLILSKPVNADLSNNAAGMATIIDNDIDLTALLANPGPQSFDEEQTYTIDITARAGARVFVSGMPPGMHWDEVNRRFDFRPDFIQGGKSWQITMEAVDGAETVIQEFMVTINNTIQPPWPELVGEPEQLTGLLKYKMRQITDGFLDSPGYAGREFTANLAIPTAASVSNPLPLRIGLHGFGGSPGTVGRAHIFGIAPHDANNSWWTGYNDQLPDGDKTTGSVPNYTQRRVMHLLSYLMENCPGLIEAGKEGCSGVDPEHISVSGQSMGGTGSFFLAINYGYHFAAISSRIGGTIPYFLSPGSRDGLSRFHWGAVELGLPSDKGINVWDFYDSSRAALNNKDFRNLHFSSISGKNDPTIPFNAMVGISPLTGTSFLSVLQKDGIGHFSVWDQRAHSGKDPALKATWWKPLDEVSFLKRNLAFPAFSNSSADEDAGMPESAGYTGALRGAKNRYQRWDSANIIDTREQLSIPIKVDIDTTGTPPINSGLPPPGNEYYGSLPITTDVTIRRIQQFQMLPGETVNWNYNGNSGAVSANDDGSVTITGLEMAANFTPLVFTRP
ncbi:MAG: hypothetical protein L3J89_13655 [Gammaproteobacteria bacterium]|nr:hypothetical protein [Gammaproteobacteria bacterium]